MRSAQEYIFKIYYEYYSGLDKVSIHLEQINLSLYVTSFFVLPQKIQFGSYFLGQ